MRNIIIKKKCLLFKHEKNNQTLSNDWPTYCHTGIWYVEFHIFKMADPSQGRIQDFKLGGAHLKKFVGYFVWKITILRQTIIFFSNFKGGGRVRPPLDPPLLPAKPLNSIARRFTRMEWNIQITKIIYKKFWNSISE